MRNSTKFLILYALGRVGAGVEIKRYALPAMGLLRSPAQGKPAHYKSVITMADMFARQS